MSHKNRIGHALEVFSRRATDWTGSSFAFAVALLVILVHPTGRWLGLDAIIHRMIFRNSREYRAEPPAAKPDMRTAKK